MIIGGAALAMAIAYPSPTRRTIALDAPRPAATVNAMPIDATQPYDDSNIFARILRGELPCTKVYEDEHALAFHDINPLAPVHILVIPKGPYVSWDDFSERASDAEISGFVRAVGHVARDAEMVVQGYRLLSNVGKRSGQEVPHLHVHIFGGQPLGPMLAH
jgi:diadenosine tetraphosphate (Ap4A) HIT family hydrolase